MDERYKPLEDRCFRGLYDQLNMNSQGAPSRLNHLAFETGNFPRPNRFGERQSMDLYTYDIFRR